MRLDPRRCWGRVSLKVGELDSKNDKRKCAYIKGKNYKENGPYAHLLWILVFDDQHNKIGLMNLQMFIL